MKSIAILVLTLLLIPVVSATIPTEEQVLQAIHENRFWYDLYHDNPEKLMSLFNERTYLWDYYQTTKDNPPAFRELDLIGDELVTFRKNLLIHAIEDNKLTINLDPTVFSPLFQNAKMNLYLSDGTTIGVIIQNKKITKLQIGALKDNTYDVQISKDAEKYLGQGSINLASVLQKKEITYTKKTISKNIVGKAIAASQFEGSSNVGVYVMILTGLCGIGCILYLKKGG